ncbi:MAG: hypothetical protein V3R24_09235 [Gemmatimonadales bacterium]
MMSAQAEKTEKALANLTRRTKRLEKLMNLVVKDIQRLLAERHSDEELVGVVLELREYVEVTLTKMNPRLEGALSQLDGFKVRLDNIVSELDSGDQWKGEQ